MNSGDYNRQVNPALRAMAKAVYEARSSFSVQYLSSVRTEQVNDRESCQLWFISPGCFHDSCGGCTMCNYGYGRGSHVDEALVLDSIAGNLSALPPEIGELIIGPTGSMLDDREVPPAFRSDILSLLREKTIDDLFIETRLDTITEEKLQQLRTGVNARHINIEIGIECMNPWVLRNCVNKDMDVRRIPHTVEMIHANGINACANLAVGFPFLNERMNIQLAVHSIQEALAIGFDEVVLFSYHVRPGTLLEVLWRHGRYDTPSLWSVSSVLDQLDEALLPKVGIAWYRDYYQDSKKILHSPHSCPQCEVRLLKLLDAYKNHPCAETRDALSRITCQCRDRWTQEVEEQALCVQFANVAEDYRFLGKLYSIPDGAVDEELKYMERTLGSLRLDQ